MKRLGLQEGEAIQHNLMTKAVERAQKRVESYNFQIRKNLIEYDMVMNNQREVIYSYRRKVLKGYDLKAEILEFIEDTVLNIIDIYFDNQDEEKNYIEKIIFWLKANFSIQIDKKSFSEEDLYDYKSICDSFGKDVLQKYQEKEDAIGKTILREIERVVLLQSVDNLWREHLHEMDFLKEGIGLRAYGQKDPLIEYKKESYKLFESLIANIAESVSKKVFVIQLASDKKEDNNLLNALAQHNSTSAFGRKETAKPNQKMKREPKKAQKKVGRNEPCPCGSGKKFKKCHGKNS